MRDKPKHKLGGATYLLAHLFSLRITLPYGYDSTSDCGDSGGRR